MYILGNIAGTLYVGVTNDLYRRLQEHKTSAVPGFTSKYGVKMLVWYEQHETRESALIRERQIKNWNPAWKLRLIEQMKRGEGIRSVIEFA